MIPLYRKELRALGPLFVLCSLMSADILYRPFFERLDESTWSGISGNAEPGEAGAIAFLLGLLAMSVAFAAFGREHDERTIELLYSLPIRKSSIFFAKVAAGLTVLYLPLALLMTTDAIQSAFNPQSINGDQWRFDLALTLTLLQMLFATVIYAHALLASVFRIFGLIPYLVFLFLMATMEDLFPPLVWATPTAILSPSYFGTSLVLPWTALIGHGVVGAAALALAYVAWMGPADRIGQAVTALKESVLSKIALGCGLAMVIGFIGLIAMGMIIEGGLPDAGGTGEDGTFATSRESSERYVFTFPTAHRERALALIEDADRLHEQVRLKLGTDPGPQIVADLTEVSADHRGIASWTNIRVGVAAEPDPVRLKRTFTHETVHAFQHRLTDRRQSDEHDATRFFAEGSAEHLAYTIVPDEESLRHARAMGAAAWVRHRMTFEDLVDDPRLRARYDTTLVYSLGELWTAALVETHGEEAIGNTLRALGREGAPRDLGSRALWEDTLRAAGYDLEAVDAAFVRLVRRVAEEEASTIDALPRIGGGIAGREDGAMRIVAELDRDPESGWTYWVQLRLVPDADDTEMFAIEGAIDASSPRRVVFRVPSILVPGPRFQILFAIRTHPEGWMWSETWQWASAPR